MSYRFRKVYADLVADDGSVLVAYLTWVRLWRRWYASAGVEIYRPDGARRLHHASAPPGPIEAGTPLAELPLRFELPTGRFALALEPQHAAWRPATPGPLPDLHWEVLLARGRGRAELPDGTVLEGTSYVDFVELTRWTRWLGLATLCWSRVHLPDRTLVLESLRTRGGDAWTPGCAWPGGEAASVLEPAADGTASARVGELAVELRPERVLHAGSAFDPERVPRRLHRAVTAIVGGPHRETRWYGLATCAGQTGRALWERVRFG